MTRTDVVVFDSNETLLDLTALDPLFQRIYGSALARERWFKQVLALMLTVTVLDSYRSFDKLADARARHGRGGLRHTRRLARDQPE